jgi:hypothetical protein
MWIQRHVDEMPDENGRHRGQRLEIVINNTNCVLCAGEWDTPDSEQIKILEEYIEKLKNWLPKLIQEFNVIKQYVESNPNKTY